MAITPDGATLIVAESYGRRLTAFDIAADGGLAVAGCGPTSARASRTGSASTPRAQSGTPTCPNGRCVRVREGGEVLDRCALDRGGFACMLGGPAGRLCSSSPASGTG